METDLKPGDRVIDLLAMERTISFVAGAASAAAAMAVSEGEKVFHIALAGGVSAGVVVPVLLQRLLSRSAGTGTVVAKVGPSAVGVVLRYCLRSGIPVGAIVALAFAPQIPASLVGLVTAAGISAGLGFLVARS